MRRLVLGVLMVLSLALPAVADEAREAQGCIYSEKLVRWVCPTPANNFLRDPAYQEVQAGGDGAAGAAGASGGDSGGSASGGNGDGGSCGSR